VSFVGCRVCESQIEYTQDRKERTWRIESFSFEYMPKVTTACGTGNLYPRHKH
jgi:hypothetical protein